MCYRVKSNDKIICDVFLEGRDEHMGVWHGHFVPSEYYDEVKEVVMEFNKSLLENDSIITECLELQNSRKKYEKLNLRLFNGEKEVLVEHIQLYDFSDVLGDDSYEIIVYGGIGRESLE